MRSSYTNMATGGGEWLESWRKSGRLLHVLHKDGPVRRRVHNFRQIKKEESKDGVKLKVAWLPFVCWEDEEYHKSRRFGDENAKALMCPACRMLEYFEQRTDLANDQVIFRFTGSGKEQRLIQLVDFLGEGESADSYQDDFRAKEEFLISLITPVGKDAGKPELKFINEKWSLAKELQRQIQEDISMVGEEVGDPSKRPIAYLWTLEDRKVKVSRIAEVSISDEVRELWAGPPPSSERECRPGNPQVLFDAVKAGLASDLADQVPVEELFAPSLQQHASSEKPDTSFDPEDMENQPKRRGRRTTRSATDEVQRLASEPAPSTPPAQAAPVAKPAPVAPAPVAQPALEAPARKTRAVRAAAPPPPPPKPEVQIFECPNCKADWPEDQPQCPSCGAVAEDAPSEVAAPPPPKPVAVQATAPATANQGGVRKPQW